MDAPNMMGPGSATMAPPVEATPGAGKPDEYDCTCPNCGKTFTVELADAGQPGEESDDGDGGDVGPSPNDAADTGLDDAGGFSFHRR